MKIAITSIIKNRQWVLQDFLDKILALNYDKKEISLIFVDDFSNDYSLDILKEFQESYKDDYVEIILLRSEKFYSNNSSSRVLQDRNKLYEHLSYLRNLVIDECIKINADFQLSVDSDILVGSDTLEHLLSFHKDYIATIVLNDNHLRAEFDYSNLLNRYINASIDLTKIPIHFKDYQLNTLYKVAMSGACYLISKNLFKYKFQGHPFGEDSGYCLNIKEPKFLETTLKVIHVMEEKYLTKGLEAFARYL